MDRQPKKTAPLAPKTVLARARRCLALEQDALAATSSALDARFVAVAQAVAAAAEAGAKLLFSGVGKNAAIAQKLAGTFNSLGLPAVFLDPTQALHGDMGLCAAGDLALLLSNSGQSEEIVRLAPLLRRFGLRTVAFTSHADSDLVRQCDLLLLYVVPQEACPLRLAPTASTTATLALGDALAMVLLQARGITRDEFARFHPAGNLGRVLLLRVSDIMRADDRLAIAGEDVSLQEAILCMTKAKSGSIALVAPRTGRLTGILTDGDFRRSALTGPGFLDKPVSTFMTRNPKVIAADALAVEALRLFEQYKIDDLIAVDDRHRPVGLVDGQDLPKLKLF